MQGEIVKQGQAVKVVDELGTLHDGLVTAERQETWAYVLKTYSVPPAT